MPNRILRDAILTSERVASLDWAAEVFYRRLHSVVDDYGRHEAGHQLLRAKCYPLQTDSVRVADIARWMAACQKSGLILVYGANGKQYLEVCDFGQQTRTASKCPPPPSGDGHCTPLLAIDSKCSQVPAIAHLDVFEDVVVYEEKKSAPPAAPPATRAEKKATRLPDDWVLPDDWRDWAKGERPDLDIAKQADQFADYWRAKPGKDGRKLDWLATWRNWIRGARSAATGFQPPQLARGGASTPDTREPTQSPLQAHITWLGDQVRRGAMTKDEAKADADRVRAKYSTETA